MGQIKTGKFISTGAAVNLNLGFIPAWAKIINHNAAADEVTILEWFDILGDSKDLWYYGANAAGAVAQDILPHTSGGYLTEYNTVSVGKTKACTFDDTGGAAEDLITCTNGAGDLPINGDVLKFAAGTGALPTTAPNAYLNYYVIDSGKYGAATFRISTVAPGRGITQSVVGFGGDGGACTFINVSNPEAVDVVGGKGLTIAAAFSDDSDVISFIAIEADQDQDLGDSADW